MINFYIYGAVLVGIARLVYIRDCQDEVDYVFHWTDLTLEFCFVLASWSYILYRVGVFLQGYMLDVLEVFRDMSLRNTRY